MAVRADPEKSGDEYYIMMHGDPTWSIPDGNSMMDFSVRMYEDEDGLNEESKKRLDEALTFAAALDEKGHLHDGFTLCSDYCFNVNPFFNEEQFDEFIVPYLKEVIAEYRKMGYYTIKHTDGNILPILEMLIAAGPHVLHSIDPVAGMSMREVRKKADGRIASGGQKNHWQRYCPGRQCKLRTAADRNRRRMSCRCYACTAGRHGNRQRICIRNL